MRVYFLFVSQIMDTAKQAVSIICTETDGNKPNPNSLLLKGLGICLVTAVKIESLVKTGIIFHAAVF